MNKTTTTKGNDMSAKNPNTRHETREEWLHRFTNTFARPLFARAGYTVPHQLSLSMGFPSKGKRGKAIGECWSSKAVDGSVHAIIIRSTLSDGARIADVLLHEIVHATVGVDKKHGACFKACALAIGLEGKMRATVAGEELASKIAAWIDAHGNIPHNAIKADAKTTSKKQTTRMIKVSCPECGYTCRTTRKWIDKGTPLCPVEDCPNYGVRMDAEG